MQPNRSLEKHSTSLCKNGYRKLKIKILVLKNIEIL